MKLRAAKWGPMVKLHCEILPQPMAQMGHERPSRSGRGSSACPLCADSDHMTAPKQSSAPCHLRTHAPQQKTLGQRADSFDYLIGAQQNRGRDVEAKRLRSLEIEHHFERGGLLHRQVGRL